MNIDDLQKRQDELREERNKITEQYQKENGRLQSEIDNIELLKWGVDDMVGKYIHINDEDLSVYMYVTSIERLFSGPKFCGFSFAMYHKHMFENRLSFVIKDSDKVSIDKDHLDIIEVISETEFEEKRFELYKEIVNESRKKILLKENV